MEWTFKPAPAVAADPCGGALGNTAEFASTQKNQGFERVTKYAEEQKEEQKQARRASRNKSQKILFKTGKFSRLRSCGRAPVWNAEIEIRKQDKNVYFSGLQTCGNSWACPVCAPKIQYQRGLEIRQAVEKAYSEGLRVYMLTWTHPHHAGQRLKDLSRQHNRARRYFKSGRWFQDWRNEHGYWGGVTAAEVTWAAVNGWHWHDHELILVKGELTQDDIHILKMRWINCLRRAGFKFDEEYDIYMHGLDVSLSHSSDYLTKMGLRGWGAEKELQGGSGKKGRDADGIRHYSPFELLENGMESQWLEYVEATQGLSQVHWTRGLKAWANVAEKTDEELSAEEIESATEQGQEQAAPVADPALLATIPRASWHKILGNEWREELLAVARNKGKRGIDEWAQHKKLDIRVPGIVDKCMQMFGGQYINADDVPA